MVGNWSLPVVNELEAIEQTLERRLGGRVRQLRVSVEPNGVIISGRCRSYHDKQMAQHIAAKISCLNVADNRIEVDSMVTRPAGSVSTGVIC